MPPWLDSLIDEAPRLIISAGTLTLFVTTFAYLSNPRAKALILAFPIPFTCAYLGSGTMVNGGYALPRIDSTHLFSLLVMVFYHWIVYWTRVRWRWPLGVSMAVGVTWFISVAAITRPWINSVTHPLAIGVALIVIWIVFVRFHRGTSEPGYRSITPWWIKAPAVFCIGLCLFNATALLGGAVTTFPYAGTFASYELRYSLRTLAGQLAINCIALIAMMLTIWGTQSHFEPDSLWPLIIGWVAALMVVAVVFSRNFGGPRASGDHLD